MIRGEDKFMSTSPCNLQLGQVAANVSVSDTDSADAKTKHTFKKTKRKKQKIHYVTAFSTSVIDCRLNCKHTT